jgi:hypothetical protein
MNTRLLLTAVFSITATFTFAAPPDLVRDDAKRILEAMDWKGVHVVSIRQGMNARGDVAPIYATIVALAARDNQSDQVCQTVMYDNDLGWHLLELDSKAARVWTKDGYKESRIFTTWWNGIGHTAAPIARPSRP